MIMSKAYKRQQAKQAPPKSQIPTPFTKAPESLAPFLDRLDPAQVYITHIDRHPPSYKRNIFLIPVVLNASIALLLLYRAYVAIPHYTLLAQTLLGHNTPLTVDTLHTTRTSQLYILLRRTLTFLFDFLLYRFIGPWPLTFFLEQPANPVSWRWKLGFRDEEIIVRESRHWGTEELMQGVKQGGENPFFKTRILPAIRAEVVDGKTGYLTMDKSWDLDFEVMGDAHDLVKEGAVTTGALNKVVWAFLEGNGWVMWKWEGEDDIVEGRRKKVVAFKDKLTAMGKESLFWKWTEIVEEERDSSGGFTQEKQEKVAKRVKSLFEKNGLDFDEVMGKFGGLDEIPAAGNVR